MRKAVLVGLGSHAALAVMCFMVLSGSNDVDLLIRVTAIAATTVWTAGILLIMLLAYRAWEGLSQPRKIGITALALPGWTLGLPIIMLYLLRSNDGSDWVDSTE